LSLEKLDIIDIQLQKGRKSNHFEFVDGELGNLEIVDSIYFVGVEKPDKEKDSGFLF
jgi:hypothetical protein